MFSCNETTKISYTIPFYNTADFDPIFINTQSEIPLKITHTIDRFSLINQDSIPITQSVFDDKIHVANFIFTSCGSICPVMTDNFKIVGEHFKHDAEVIMLSYSVTPWIDKPYILKKYKIKNGISNLNWHFLTGDKNTIYTLARKSYFAEEKMGYNKDSSEFLHTEHVMLVDKAKRIRGIYNGTLRLEMQHLVEDIEMLKKEP